MKDPRAGPFMGGSDTRHDSIDPTTPSLFHFFLKKNLIFFC
jgi:hypothetical protein